MVSRDHESDEDKDSRLLLIGLLTVTDRLLDQLLEGPILNAPISSGGPVQQLQIIWKAARASLRGVTESLRVGLSRARRKALDKVGMFGASLKAKFELLTFDIKENAVKRVLKRLNSLLGSLAKIFEPLHAVKEIKEHVEIYIEALKEPLELVSLAEVLEP